MTSASVSALLFCIVACVVVATVNAAPPAGGDEDVAGLELRGKRAVGDEHAHTHAGTGEHVQVGEKCECTLPEHDSDACAYPNECCDNANNGDGDNEGVEDEKRVIDEKPAHLLDETKPAHEQEHHEHIHNNHRG